ncbi:MAG: hypothetical protein KGN02_09515 [bacterium]|nr:hypothetical protein [bacterium]
MALARAVWLCTAVMFFGIGVGGIWVPGSARVAALRDRARSLDDAAARNDAIVRRSRALERIRSQVAADARRLAGRASSGALIAAALGTIAARARGAGVRLTSFDPDAQTSASNSIAAGPTPYPFEIGLRGDYRSILTFTRELTLDRVLIEVTRAELKVRDARRAGAPELDATLHVAIHPAPALSELEDK